MKPNQHSPKVGLTSLKSSRLFPLLLCSLNANAAPFSFISFQVPFWTQYKWHIIGVIALCIVEALLILALLIQRSRQSRTEDSLRLSEEKFYKAFRSSPDALVIVRDSDGKILEINDRWQIMLGYDRLEAIGRTTADLALYVKLADHSELLARMRAEGYARDFETYIRTKSGEIRTVRVSAESITINKEGCFLAILHDVTELENSGKALRQSEERNRLVVDTAMDAASLPTRMVGLRAGTDKLNSSLAGRFKRPWARC